MANLTRPTAVALLLTLPAAGCQGSPPEAVPRDVEIAALSGGLDRRPEAGIRDVGEDITDLVRAQNAPDQEPPLPSRKGVVSRTPIRPRISRNADGYVARLPGASAVATPAYHRGRVYVGGFGTYQLHALDAETGRASWSIGLSDDGPTDPACEDGICVFNTFSCTLFAVDAETGKHLWSWYLGSPQLATPVLADGAVYSSYPDSSGPSEARFVIAKFDLQTGKPSWRRRIDAEVQSTPVAHDGRIFLATRLGTYYEFAADDGAVLAARRSRIASPPVLAAQGVVFARDEVERDNDLIATATPIFPELEASRRPVEAPAPRPRPLLVDQRLLTVDAETVVATDLRTGKRLWRRTFAGDAPARVSAPLLYAGDSVLMATAAGNVLRVDADTGEVTSRFSLGVGALASPPIAVDGWLYAGNFEGAMVAFDTGAPELTGWEMLGGGPERQGARHEEGT